MTETIYHPHLGSILLNGNLRVPTAVRSEDGGDWDGEMEISPSHPNYAAWLAVIDNKEQHLAVLCEERRRAREARRRAAEWKHEWKQAER